MIYSHRGESRYAPENTMSAFFLAYLLNSDGIECDIRKSKDGQLVIIHDKTINRTSNGKGRVDNHTIDELRKYNFGNNKYDDEKILTLDEFLKIFSNKNINILLEVKEPGYEIEIWRVLSKYNLNNIVIISFEYGILENFRKISKIIRLGWLVYEINRHIIDESKKIKIDLIICNSLFLNRKNVDSVKKCNLKIGAWGVKNKAELKRLDKLNLDVLVYDSYYDAKKELKNV